MEKVLVFDMDGTIANLYGVRNWLDKIQAEDPTPYAIAKPLYDMFMLNAILWTLKNDGWHIVVTTWLAKDSTPEYDTRVRTVKRAWLDRYGFPFDELHMVKYGTTKANCTRHLGGYQILVDDNEDVRNGWHLGDTINANENILQALRNLIAQ